MQNATRMKSGSPEFDFDEWSRLARQDPAAFERRRQATLDALITSAPDGLRHRLEGLQWQLDRVRERSGTPLAACIRMQDMMWSTVLGEGGLLEALNRLASGGPPPPPARSAEIVPLRRRPRDTAAG